jgi:hypothetical protein
MHRMWRASCLITFDKSSGKGRGVYRAGNDLNYGFVEGTAKGPFLVNKGMLIEQPSVAHSRIAVTRPETYRGLEGYSDGGGRSKCHSPQRSRS